MSDHKIMADKLPSNYWGHLAIDALAAVMVKHNLFEIEIDGIKVKRQPEVKPLDIPAALKDAMSTTLSDDEMLENPFKGIPGFEEPSMTEDKDV